jgi:hypothetical protein
MLDETKIRELKSLHKELVCVESTGGVQLIFRKPKRLEFDQWFDNREKGSQAGMSLAQQCLIYPTPQEFAAVLDERPGLLMCREGIVDSITDLAGADGGITSKKL